MPMLQIFPDNDLYRKKPSYEFAMSLWVKTGVFHVTAPNIWWMVPVLDNM